MKINLETYCSISKVINNSDYAKDMGIKVKKVDNLFMLNYDKSKLNKENIHGLGLFRSVITDGEKIVSDRDKNWPNLNEIDPEKLPKY